METPGFLKHFVLGQFTQTQQKLIDFDNIKAIFFFFLSEEVDLFITIYFHYCRQRFQPLSQKKNFKAGTILTLVIIHLNF